MTPRATRIRGALPAVLATAVRVAAGALWLNEGLLKYRAGFGAADIELVVSSAQSNPRVPEVFSSFATHVLGEVPHFFGAAMPALETALGLLLIVGLFTVPVAVAAIATLLMYWSADQLIGQYPVMLALCVVLLLCPVASTRWSSTTLIHRPPLVGSSRPPNAEPTDFAV